MKYYPIIGLEVHLELETKSKVFCGCSTQFGNPVNTQVCPVCLGLPGSLPVLNKEALFLGIKVALALNCKISNFIKFDRKNYFYPDLPKNFQISQYDKPLSSKGYLDIEIKNEVKRIGIRRVHLEEDTGKLLHKEREFVSLIDFNRSGIPLLEIVSEPDINSPDEAYEYLTQLKAVLEYLEVSDCDMEKGSLRCDANISISSNIKKLGIKTEIKNMNSFKAVRSALAYEIARQTEALENQDKIVQETRLWDDAKAVTAAMRSKEEAHDYRYFPEPDLVPFVLNPSQIDQVNDVLPQLPAQRKKRLMEDYKISEYDAKILTQDKALADYFEDCVEIYNAECSRFGSDASACRSGTQNNSNIRHNPKAIVNWLLSDIAAIINAKLITIRQLNLSVQNFVEMLRMIDANIISGKMAKDILLQMVETGRSAKDIVEEKGLKQICDEDVIKDVVDKVLKENVAAIEDFKKGKEQALIFLVGQLMKHTKGKANPAIANKILRKRLK